jgi:hypothetical protein
MVQMTKPWWYPQRSDDRQYLEELKSMCDEICPSDTYLIERFNNGLKYVNTHDHLGDAAAEHEVLADNFLEMETSLRELVAKFGPRAAFFDRLAIDRAKALLDKIDNG